MNLQIPIPPRLESPLLTASLPPDYQIDKDTTTGAEVVYKRAKGTATGSVGFSKRFSAACTRKAVVTSPLPLNGAAAAPVLTLQTTADVFTNTDAHIAKMAQQIHRSGLTVRRRRTTRPANRPAPQITDKTTPAHQSAPAICDTS